MGARGWVVAVVLGLACVACDPGTNTNDVVATPSASAVAVNAPATEVPAPAPTPLPELFVMPAPLDQWVHFADPRIRLEFDVPGNWPVLVEPGRDVDWRVQVDHRTPAGVRSYTDAPYALMVTVVGIERRPPTLAGPGVPNIFHRARAMTVGGRPAVEEFYSYEGAGVRLSFSDERDSYEAYYRVEDAAVRAAAERIVSTMTLRAD